MSGKFLYNTASVIKILDNMKKKTKGPVFIVA